MTAAAFLSIAPIHLLASINPGPAFVVSVRTAAAEGFRRAAAYAVGVGSGVRLGLLTQERARAAYGRGKRWIDRAFGRLIGALGIRIAAG